MNADALRHDFASHALGLGKDLPLIGKLPGHTQVRTTARNAHLDRDTAKGVHGAHQQRHRAGSGRLQGEPSGRMTCIDYQLLHSVRLQVGRKCCCLFRPTILFGTL